MNRSRFLLGVGGGAIFLVGLLTVVSPSTANALPFEGLVETLGGTYVFTALFGAIAFAIVVGVMVARAIDGIDESTPPDPEEVYQVPQPGHEFDQFVESGGGLPGRVLGTRHDRARERVQRTAISTLMRTEGMSRKEAEAAIRNGTWTNDTTAAAFLSDRQRPSLGQRLVAAIVGESPFQEGARRAAIEIARYDEGSR